jgi:hypothetical protein
MARDVNEMIFPGAVEGDKIFWEDELWYIRTNGIWVLEDPQSPKINNITT